jgi:hypothetical protein
VGTEPDGTSTVPCLYITPGHSEDELGRQGPHTRPILLVPVPWHIGKGYVCLNLHSVRQNKKEYRYGVVIEVPVRYQSTYGIQLTEVPVPTNSLEDERYSTLENIVCGVKETWRGRRNEALLKGIKNCALFTP